MGSWEAAGGRDSAWLPGGRGVSLAPVLALLCGLMSFTSSLGSGLHGPESDELPSSLPVPYWPSRVRMGPEVGPPDLFGSEFSLALGLRVQSPDADDIVLFQDS